VAELQCVVFINSTACSRWGR